MVSVILACGGSSSRMGGNNKLLMKIGGLTVIERTILAFDDIEDVGEIIISCPENFKDDFYRNVTSVFKKEIRFVAGGPTRQLSVANAFRACDPASRLVCIHDGARPLISEETIRLALADGEKYGSAIVCVPCKDTIKVSDGNGRIVETPPRNRLFSAQTPQVFTYDAYKEAVGFSETCGFDFTDDSQLLEAMGISTHITVGEYSNIKITTPEDIPLAEQLLGGGRKGNG